jgi:hypothetical protein
MLRIGSGVADIGVFVLMSIDTGQRLVESALRGLAKVAAGG